jgi:outer membrane protein assembly factor BamB
MLSAMIILRRVLVMSVLVVAMAGCWPTPGAGPDRRSSNPFERTLTPETVGGLVEQFRVPLARGAGPPVVTSAGLFVRSGPSITALEPATGARRWSAVVPESYDPEDDWRYSVSEPHIGGNGRQVLATATTYRTGGFLDSQLVTLDAASGVPSRRTAAGPLQSLRGDTMASIEYEATGDYPTTLGVAGVDGGPAWGGAAVEVNGGVGTLGVGRLFRSAGTEVLAYDTTTPCPPSGRPEPSRFCEPSWVRSLGAPATPVVIGDDATVFVGASGYVYALDAGSGAVRWRSVAGNEVQQPPALAGGTLYLATADGRLSAFRAGGCGSDVCPAVWTTPLAIRFSVQPAVAGGVVYVGAADGTVTAFDAAGCGAQTCAPLWTIDVGAPVSGGLAVEGGRLYVGTTDSLVAYGLPPA